MENSPIIGLGAGGHAKVVIEILRLMGHAQLVGLLDTRRELWGTTVFGMPVLGDDALLERLFADGIRRAFIGVGGVAGTRPRQQVYERVRTLGFEVVSAIHPNANVSVSAQLGYGVTIMAGAIVNAEAILGKNVIINTGAIVEHNCVIGNHVHIATGARLAGAVHVGDGVHIGLGACIRQGVEIGAGAIVGAGAVVLDAVPERVVVAGVPARELRKVQSL